MQQLIEFVSNNAVLSAGFVAVLLALVWTEFAQRGRGFKVVSTAEAVQMMNREEARVVDVSPQADFNKAHITGAHNVVMSRLESPDKQLTKWLVSPLLVTCKSGQTAQQAAAKLVKLGAQNVAVIRGGNGQWMADNYPISRS